MIFENCPTIARDDIPYSYCVIILVQFGATATDEIQIEWLSIVFTHASVRQSHNLTDWSDPEAMKKTSSEMASEKTTLYGF
jgi:hypothetical protein